MPFDIVLPSIVSLVSIAIIFLYPRFEARMKPLLEEKEFRIRDAILLVVGMAIMVTIIALVPQQAILILFLAAYSFVLFLLTFITVEKWYLALLPPVVFVASYFSGLWGIELANIFALAFAILVSLYLGSFFSWVTVLVFAGLITVMDVIQVFVTGFMGSAAVKFIDLQLPVLIQVSTFPIDGVIFLGLGDIFLAGLLVIQTMQKYGRKVAILSAVTIGLGFFLFESAVFYSGHDQPFPATLVVIGGWIIGLGMNLLVRRLRGS